MHRAFWAMAAALLGLLLLPLTGCGPAIDKAEIEQAANPVKEMHQDVQQKLKADEDKVQWYSYENAVIKARKEGKFVMVDFYASWCKWCKKFENETVTDPAVAEKLKAGFVPVKLDAESSTRVVYEMRQMQAFELADEYDVESYPTIWFLEPDGKRAKKLNGYLDGKEFARYLDYITSGAYREGEFQ